MSTTSNDNYIAKKLIGREYEIAHLVAQGLSNGQISERLGITSHTIKSHLGNIYCRLGIMLGHKRVRLARWVLLGGLER